jgi:hypothetical protein
MTTQEATRPGRPGAVPAERRAAKRQRREAVLADRERWQRAERRRRQLIWGGAIAAAVVALAALGMWLFGPEPGPAVQTLPIQGRVHIQRGQPHPPYNSNPPTSGWHFADAVAPWGIAGEPVADEVQIHNLEHGGIVIQYDCPSGCPETVSSLEGIVRSFPSKVLLAPRPGMNAGHPIAVTAWGRLAYLDSVDEAFIRRFVARFKDKGPEQVPD